MPSFETIVDEETGCAIDMSTIGSVFNSIWKYLEDNYREHEAEYLFKKYCIPLWEVVKKNIDIFFTFNMSSNYIKNILNEYIDIDDCPVYENKWFKMLEDFCNHFYIGYDENDEETKPTPWWYPDLNDDL